MWICGVLKAVRIVSVPTTWLPTVCIQLYDMPKMPIITLQTVLNNTSKTVGILCMLLLMISDQIRLIFQDRVAVSKHEQTL